MVLQKTALSVIIIHGGSAPSEYLSTAALLTYIVHITNHKNHNYIVVLNLVILKTFGLICTNLVHIKVM